MRLLQRARPHQASMSQRPVYEAGCRLHGVFRVLFKIQESRAQNAALPRTNCIPPRAHNPHSRLTALFPLVLLAFPPRAHTVRTPRAHFRHSPFVLFSAFPRVRTHICSVFPATAHIYVRIIACVPTCTVTFSTPHHSASVPAPFDRARPVSREGAGCIGGGLTVLVRYLGCSDSIARRLYADAFARELVGLLAHLRPAASCTRQLSGMRSARQPKPSLVSTSAGNVCWDHSSSMVHHDW